MFAIISSNGNQCKVMLNKEYDLENFELEKEDQKSVKFEEVMLISDEKKTLIGEPFIKGASVDAEIVDSGKGEKVTIFKFHSKKRYKRTLGHRQEYIRVKILKINEKNEK